METAYGVAYQAEVQDGGAALRGVASTIGTVDRSKRCFLPGAFGSKPIKVPMLAYHADDHPVGVSTLMPATQERIGAQLTHTSRLSNVQGAADLRTLISDGAIPATSIGWHSDEDYWGWAALERGNPALAAKAKRMGISQSEDIHYFASVQVMENSLTPVPANPFALLAVASVAKTDHERAFVESLIELAGGERYTAAGARHSQADAGHIQAAHDALSMAGAVCGPLPPGANEPTARDYEPNPGDNSGQGITGGWQRFIRTPYGSAITSGDVPALSALIRARLEVTPLVIGDTTNAALGLAQWLAAEFEGCGCADDEEAHFTAATGDDSPWDGPAAMSACTHSKTPASCFNSICAGKRAGDPANQSAHALPHHKTPGGPPNRGGVAAAWAALNGARGGVQGLTNLAAAKAHIAAHRSQLGMGDGDSDDNSSSLTPQEHEKLHADLADWERQLTELKGEVPRTEIASMESGLAGLVSDEPRREGDEISELESALARFTS